MKFRLIFFLLIIPVFLFSETIIWEIEEPEIQQYLFQNNLPQNIEPGEPMIPYIPMKILLPMGEKFTNLQVKLYENGQPVENIYIDFARQQQPISQSYNTPTLRNDSIYLNNEFYPQNDFEILGTQRLKGYDILFVNLFPYKYNPVSKQVFWFRKAEVNVSTEFDESTYNVQEKFLLKNYKTQQEISELVDNSEKLNTYHKNSSYLSRNLPNPEDPHQMLIITDDVSAPWFNDFIDWKISQGIQTGIFLTSDIYDNYTGVDNQDKVRNFIIDAYSVYSATSIPLEYVLFGGDDEIVPNRGVHGQVGGTIDNHMPCDMYYSCLEGSWDGNGNGIYGENSDDVDMLPEIAIGRIPAETEEEFNNFFNKNYSYVDNISVGNDIAFFIGENLNNNPLTWGGDYKDVIAPILDDGFHLFTLYEKDNTYSASNVRDAINSGLSIINHMGHANETIVFGQNSGMASTYTNTEFGFAYTQGCYPAAFDNSTSGTTESIGENFITNTGGLYAFIGNTRYGWYAPGSVWGASEYFDITFFEALFDKNIRELGKALNDSKIELLNEALTSGVMRWVYYELILFGDPSVMVKDPVGYFPFIQPTSIVYDDIQGDGDNMINPGETIDIYVELENLLGWGDATGVYATINIENEDIIVIQDSVFYGNIVNGSSLISAPFMIEVPQDCEYGTNNYTLEISAPVSGDAIFNRTYSLSFEVSLYQKYWPWHNYYTLVSNPIICDFNQDSEKEVMIIDVMGNINLLDIEAQFLNGFPWTNDESIWKSTAYADIDEDEIEEIIVASRSGRIFVLDNNGNLVFEYFCDASQLLTPIISDVNGDNLPEIISFGMDKKLIVLDPVGNLLPGFPVELSTLLNAEMASADINQNGKNEIIIGNLFGEVDVINENGESIAGFPVNLNSPICAAPTILDNFVIAVGTSDSKFHLIDDSGTILISVDVDSKISNSPILADFNNDGNLEIAFATQNGGIYIVNQDGSNYPGWPVFINLTIQCPPVVVDLDNDDELDVLCFTSANDFYAFHCDGTEIDFSPVPIGITGNIPASVGDIDSDGDFDIVAGSSNEIFILDAKLPKGTQTPWATYRGNLKRTGFYGDNELTSSENINLPEITSALYQNYPNPFNPETTISFFTTENTESTKLVIYNLKGQKVKTLVNEALSAGKHTVVWNGKDKNERNVATGIYFYKLDLDGKTIAMKKCLLLK